MLAENWDPCPGFRLPLFTGFRAEKVVEIDLSFIYVLISCYGLSSIQMSSTPRIAIITGKFPIP